MNELRFAFFALLASSAVGCVETHRPPSASPTASMPAPREPLAPASPGFGHVMIETDVPSRVERVVLSEADGRTRREVVCSSTPCTVTLPYGAHELIFQGRRGRQGKTIIAVQKPSVVVHHTLGHQRVDLLGPLGGFFVVTGAVMLGFASAMMDSSKERHRPYPTTARDLAIAGVSSVALGGVMILVAPTGSHDGRTTQASSSSSSSASLTGGSVSAGVRF